MRAVVSHAALRKAGACAEERRVARQLWPPAGIPLTLAAVRKAAKHGLDWSWTARLLTAQAWAEYERVRAQAWAEYERVRAQARAEYQRVMAQAWAEYQRLAQVWAEYERVMAQALAEYERVTAPAWAEYERVRAQALLAGLRKSVKTPAKGEK